MIARFFYKKLGSRANEVARKSIRGRWKGHREHRNAAIAAQAPNDFHRVQGLVAVHNQGARQHNFAQ